MVHFPFYYLNTKHVISRSSRINAAWRTGPFFPYIHWLSLNGNSKKKKNMFTTDMLEYITNIYLKNVYYAEKEYKIKIFIIDRSLP